MKKSQLGHNWGKLWPRKFNAAFNEFSTAETTVSQDSSLKQILESIWNPALRLLGRI
jgi:hypothetical protein